MASVLFSTLGQALGGPLGAAVGATVGASLDSKIFGRKRAASGDVFVQRSSYGDLVPRVFGRMRTAGQLIWSTLPHGPGGKGSGRGSANISIAVAVSSGPIEAIGRIWADGREIRNAAGDFEARTIMRVHSLGSEPEFDPLILSVEGENSAPGYRNLSYVVLEQMDLAPFGNRIPNLNFEVIADDDDADRWLADLLAESGLKALGNPGDRRAIGFVASGDILADADALSRFGGLFLGYEDGAIRFAPLQDPVVLAWEDMLPAGDAETELSQEAKPSAFTLSYLDPDRDYQTGAQRVSRGRPGAEVDDQELVSATATMAQALARDFLRQLEAGSETVRFALPWRWLGLAVGDLVVLGGRGPFRITEKEIRGLAVHCRAQRVISGWRPIVVESDAGRAQTIPMVPAGPTDIRLLELPMLADGGAGAMCVWASGGPNWKGASVRQLAGGGEQALGEVHSPSARGVLVNSLPPGNDLFWDHRNSLLVALEPESPVFESKSKDDVLAGANMLWVGQELLQYCDAELQSDGSVKLSGLLRSRFATGFDGAGAPGGAAVIQIEWDRLLKLALSGDAIGREIVVAASGPGDPAGGSEASAVFAGLGLAPMAPVHVRVSRGADGSFSCSWVPRTRENWEWLAQDGAGTGPWRWRFEATGGGVVAVDLDQDAISFTREEQISLTGAPFSSGTIHVEALGNGPEDFRRSTIFVNEA